MLPTKITDKELNETLVSRLPLRPAAVSKYGASPMTGEEIREAFDLSAKLLAAKLNAVIACLSESVAELPYKNGATLGDLLAGGS